MSDSPTNPQILPLEGSESAPSRTHAPADDHDSHPTIVLRHRHDGRPVSDHVDQPPADLPPPPVPGYEILAEIGRGGTSIVYKARQLSLDRVVALKMLHTVHACPPERLARFRAEAEAIARLHHPNIIQVHEVGVAGSGPFFVLEYAGGGSLADRLDGTPLPPATAASLVGTIAQAVQHAHSRGIVHRDVKPGNVLLIEAADVPLESCTVKVTDFGLARLLDEGRNLTITGQVMGTPGYMPPEQASGPAEAIGPAADVYSLGVILYELLTGHQPYRGETAIETVRLMLDQEPLPPSRLRRELPRDLETVCLKCLQKEPHNRYASAQEVADDLGRWARGEAIVARPTPAWERAWKWSRRRPVTSALSMLAAVLLAYCFAMLFVQWRRAEDARVRSEAERERAVRLAESEAKARAEAQRLSARLLLERGVGLCEGGDVGPGLLWLVNGLEKSPAEAVDQRRSLHLLLGGWAGQLHTLGASHRYPGKVSAVAWGKDGKLAVVSGREVYYWDASGPLSEPVKLPGEVLALFSRSAAVVAEGKLTLCSLPDGKVIGPAIDVRYRARSASLSAEGDLLLVGGDDHHARLYRVSDGSLIGKPWPHDGPVRAVAIAPDGQWAVTGSDDKQVRLWAVPSGELSMTMKEHTAPVGVVAFSADGKHVLSGGEDHRLCLWQRGSQAVLHVRKHEHQVNAVAFHPSGEWMATGSHDNTARLWRVGDGQPLGSAVRHADDVTAVAFSPTGRRLATASRDGTLRIWNVRDGGTADVELKHPGPVLAMARGPDSLLLTTCNDNAVRLWDAAAGTCQVVTKGATGTTVAFAADGKTFLVGQWDGGLRVYETATLKELIGPLRHGAAVLSAAFSPDGRLIATGCGDEDRIVRLWDWRRGVVVREFPHKRKVPSLAFSPDGKRLLTASWDYHARLWDVESGELTAELEHRDLVQGVAFGPKGLVALSVGDDYVAKLWDVPAGRSRQIPLKHPDKVQAVAFSPRGFVVATGGKGGRVRLWDVKVGKPLGPPLGHAGEVHSLAFDADGRWLWSSSWDGTVRRWRVPALRNGSVTQIRTWVEAQTGQRLDESGSVVALTLDEWEERVRAMRGR